MANTLLNAAKDLRNDSLRELVSQFAFIGEYVPYFQGRNYGYASGGTSSTGQYDVIDRFAFASDFSGTATDVGDLTQGRYTCSGQSSSENGYTSCGNAPPVGAALDIIDKFPFASGFTTATDVGNMSAAKNKVAGQSSIPYGYGYNTSGGNAIDKFTFASDGNSSQRGTTLTSRSYATGQSSTTHGYTSGNYPYTTDIDKFPFAADDNATDVGDLSLSRGVSAGQSSTESGYTSGGNPLTAYPPAGWTIDKFPFASDANATDVGDLSTGRHGASGQSSTAHGYTSGGYGPGPSPTNAKNVIDKFPFASGFNGNATDVGDLTAARYYGAGQQY
jgi:hypothetical protein